MGSAKGSRPELVLQELGYVRLARAIEIEGNDGEAVTAALRLETGERGKFLDARRTPGGPKIEQHRPAFEIGQSDLFAAAVAVGFGRGCRSVVLDDEEGLVRRKSTPSVAAICTSG